MTRFRLAPLVLCAGCSAMNELSYLLPQENRLHHIDIEVTDEVTGDTLATVSLEDREGYSGSYAAHQIFSWPAFDNLGFVNEMVWIGFLPNFQGQQDLRDGEIITPSGTWPMVGHRVDMDVIWEGKGSFPFSHEGTFTGDPVGGIIVTGSFTLSNSNCKNGTISEQGTDGCGMEYQDRGTHDVTWTVDPNLDFCPPEVLDAVVGAPGDGFVSHDALGFGELELECTNNYNARYMCGQDPVTVEVDGCTWEVVVRGGPQGTSSDVTNADRPVAWLAVTATSTCDTAPVNVCDSWFAGAVVPE